MKNKIKSFLLTLGCALTTQFIFKADSIETENIKIQEPLIADNEFENTAGFNQTIEILKEIRAIDFVNAQDQTSLERLSSVETATKASNELYAAQEDYNNNANQQNLQSLKIAKESAESAFNVLEEYEDILRNADPVTLAISTTEVYKTAMENYNTNPTNENQLTLADARNAMENAYEQIIDFEYQDLYNSLVELLEQALAANKKTQEKYNAQPNQYTSLLLENADTVVDSIIKSIQDLMETKNYRPSQFNNPDYEQKYNAADGIPVESVAKVAIQTIQKNIDSGLTAWEAFKEWTVNLLTNPILAKISWQILCEIIYKLQPKITEKIIDLKTTMTPSESINDDSLISDQEVLNAIQKLNNLGAKILKADSTKTYTEENLTQALHDAQIKSSYQWKDYFDSYQILQKALDQRVSEPIALQKQ